MKPTLPALVAMVVAPFSAAAQAPNPHALRDSLAVLTDTAALRRIAHAEAGSRTNLEHLRRGFASLRLYELTHEPAAAERARAAFERARDLAPDDGFADLGLGLSLVALADVRDADRPTIVAGRAIAEALGFDARSRARRALERALAAEPALAEAAVALAHVALSTGGTDALRAAYAALSHTTALPGTSAASWLARARLALALGEPADALAAADAALAIGGPVRPEALHARAVALLRSGGRAAEGARAYFDAARALTPATADLMRDEILELTDPAERARFDALPLAERAAFLEAFWDVRAGLAGVPLEDRLAEHHRRLALALALYRRTAKWGAVPLNALLRTRPEARFDDRGLMLVRHGEPLDIVRTGGRDMPRNESWLYRNPAGDPFMVHFIEYDDFSDYVLIYNVPCASAWLADRVGYDARMNVLHHRCNASSQRGVSYEIRREVYEALATDSNEPAFAVDLDFAYDLHTFRGPAGTTDILLSATMAAASLRATADGGGVMRALHLSLAVVDTAARAVARGETLAPADDDRARAHLLVSAAPAHEAVVRVVARDAGRDGAGGSRGRALSVRDYRGDTLMVSDLLIAAPVEMAPDANAWERAGVRLILAPEARFDTGSFRVFAEIYNLASDGRYATELRVERASGGVAGAVRRLFGGGTPVRLRFDDQATPDPDGVVRVLHDVRADLPPGRYLLTLRVTLPDGRAVERVRPLRIDDPG